MYCLYCGKSLFSISKPIDECERKNDKKYFCMLCGEPMEEIKDRIANKKTGHIWRCKCMPSDMNMSIG